MTDRISFLPEVEASMPGRRGVVDYAVLLLFFSTMIWYWFQSGADFSRSVPILSFRLNFAASSYFDIFALDMIGIFLWGRIGALKSLMFVIMVGALDLYTWGVTEWVWASPWSTTVHTFQDPRAWVFTALWLVAGPSLLWLFRDKVVWRLNPVFFAFPVYYIVYFLGLHAPFAGGEGNTVWELLYEGIFDLAMVSGFFWKVKKEAGP